MAVGVIGADTNMRPGSGPFLGLATIVVPGIVASAIGVPPGVMTVYPTVAPHAAPVAVGSGTAWTRAAKQAALGPPKAGCAQGGFPGPGTATAQTVAFTPVKRAPLGFVPGFP